MPANWYDPAGLPKFERPPVIETAMAVEFVPVLGMDFFQLTRLQSEWAERLPDLSEVPGAPPTPSRSSGEMIVNFGAPPKRIWAAGRGDGRLLQTQSDRLIYNWRKLFSKDPYPGYNPTLRNEFEQAWDEMGEFMESSHLPKRAPNLAEYTYVNAVPVEEELSYSDVVALIGAPANEIPGSESFTRFQFVRDVGKVDGHPFDGQVHVTGEPQDLDGSRHLIFTVTARVELSESDDPLVGLDAAHALALHTFAGVITPEVVAKWGLIDA